MNDVIQGYEAYRRDVGALKTTLKAFIIDHMNRHRGTSHAVLASAVGEILAEIGIKFLGRDKILMMFSELSTLVVARTRDRDTGELAQPGSDTIVPFHLHVGTGLAEAAERVRRAAAEVTAGGGASAGDHLSFESWEALAVALRNPEERFLFPPGFLIAVTGLKLTTDDEHALALAIIDSLMELDLTPESPLGRRLIEIAVEVNAYETVRWPLDTTSLADEASA